MAVNEDDKFPKFTVKKWRIKGITHRKVASRKIQEIPKHYFLEAHGEDKIRNENALSTPAPATPPSTSSHETESIKMAVEDEAG